jgi:hypothetical protein
MTVSLTISESLSGAALNDSLAGGGQGLDYGSCTNGSFAPLTDRAANTGHQNLYIRHNAVIDPVTSVKFYLGEYGAITGYTYGGARTAAGDLADIFGLGNASGSSKNNEDGLSGGIWIDQRWNASSAAQFDKATYPTKVSIFGDNGTDGVDLASAFNLDTDAMVYDNSGTETAATAPVAGEIGVSGDTALGDQAHIRTRVYLPQSHAEGGIFQFEFCIAYSFTS